tara:strand:- start:60 stop:602 length:543 start_codon:yes stop_codon:yes gene_type:complete
MQFDFNYLATFLSLFYGLAIMHALTCISSYIHNYKKISNYWVWWMWAIYLIIVSCALWMGLYERWGNLPDWERYYTVYLTLHSSLIYLLFSIFFDDFNALKNASLEEQYYKNKKFFFIFLTVAILAKIVGKLIVSGSINMYFNILQISIFIFLAFSNNRKMHFILSLLSFLFLVMSVFKI